MQHKMLLKLIAHVVNLTALACALKRSPVQQLAIDADLLALQYVAVVKEHIAVTLYAEPSRLMPSMC